MNAREIVLGVALERLDADIAIIGDFRFPGGTSTSIASEISALAAGGYRVALVSFATTFLSKRRSFHPAITAEIAAGHAELAAPGQAIKVRLACLHHPVLFENLPADPLNVSAEQAVLVIHHPPFDAEGQAQYDIPTIRKVLDCVMQVPVAWAPVGPKVRRQMQRLADPPPLTPDDWVNIIDADQFGPDRPGVLSGRPVVGRHSRPDPLKWPDTVKELEQAYPVADDIAVHLMGFDKSSVSGFQKLPENWQIRPFNSAPVQDFLNSIDFFSYFHGSRWIEAFGRSILEAMAAGVVCLLPRDFEPLFGEGAVYCKPQDVAETVRRLHTSPDDYIRRSQTGVALVREKFSPAVAVARVADRIGPPASNLAAPAVSQALKPKVLYFTSNGIGMGHLTRVLACARRHRETAEPVVVSMSRAFGVARREGIMAEFIPFFRSSGMDEEKWHRTMRSELTEVLGFYRPRVLVLDGNVPYRGLLQACEDFPAMWSVWLRRAMWPPDTGAHFIEHHAAFDSVIEPGEFAGMLDRGLTVEKRGDSKCVAPIGYLEAGEALERGAARSVLGLDAKRPAVFLQLGSGNNMQTAALRDAIIAKLTTDIVGPTPQIVVGEWQIGENSSKFLDHVTVLKGFPFSRFLKAFDYAVALAGYNTFHENLTAGLPTLFLGNEHPEQDEQWLRASFAEVRGCALAARSGNIYDVLRKLFELSDPAVQAALQKVCRTLPRANGADETASYLNDLAHTRRAHPARPPI